MRSLIFASLLAAAAMSSSAIAQKPVIAAQNADQLSTGQDPQLDANKQVVYRIMRDLLGAGQWAKAGELLSDEYIQHNPNAKSGRPLLYPGAEGAASSHPGRAKHEDCRGHG